jgi:hypothetical protein
MNTSCAFVVRGGRSDLHFKIHGYIVNLLLHLC